MSLANVFLLHHPDLSRDQQEQPQRGGHPFSAHALVAVGPISTGPGQTPPIVSTASGRVHGKIDPVLPNVRQYLGVPFAVPPVGERPWTAPELLHTSRGCRSNEAASELRAVPDKPSKLFLHRRHARV